MSYEIFYVNCQLSILFAINFQIHLRSKIHYWPFTLLHSIRESNSYLLLERQPSKPLDEWSKLPGKQDSNLRPPASKTGKQPPLSFQFADSLQNSFPRDSRIGNFRESLRSMRESNSQYLSDSQVGYHYLNRPFFAESKGIEPSLLS